MVRSLSGLGRGGGHLYGNQVSTRGLEHIARFLALSSVSLSGIKGPSSGLGFLSPLVGMVHLRIDGESWLDLNGEGHDSSENELSHLSGMKRLESLTLGAPITDAGMAHLARLKSLRWLQADDKGNQITDDGLARLSGMKELRNLLLAGRFTSAGLKHLEGLENLSQLSLACRPGAISAEAIEKLEARCPSLQQVTCTPVPKPTTPAPKVGRAAPDFEVVAFDGRKVRLNDLKGKIVLLDFWATWCTPCMADTPRLKSLIDEHRAEAFQAISLNMGVDSHLARRHVQRQGLDGPQAWLAKDSKILTLYAVDSAPHYVVIKPDGTIAYAGRELDAARTAVASLAKSSPPRP